MNIVAEMAKARRVAVQKGRIPQEFVLNPQAWSLLVKQTEKVDFTHIFGEDVLVIANRQKTPTVALRCKGELHPVG